MTSPTADGAGSSSGPGMNTEPFATTNPFSNDEDGATNPPQRSVRFPDEQQTPNSPESPTTGRKQSKAESKAESEVSASSSSHSEIQSQKREASHDSTLKDKTNSATDDGGQGVMEKIKTAVSDRFHLHSIHATGASKFFNPTTVRAHIKWKDDDDANELEKTASRKAAQAKQDIALLWRSRDNRKGRNSMAVPMEPLTEMSSIDALKYKFDLLPSMKEVATGSWKMFTTFPYWDMAFWSGWSYSIGSALFVIDGAFSWGPQAFPGGEFAGEEEYGVPLCFFFGAIFYQIGAVMAYLEAVNDGSFHGSAMRRLLEGHEDDQKKMLDEKIHGFFGHFVPHIHHHDTDESEKKANAVDPEAGWKTLQRRDRPGSIYPRGKRPAPRRGGVDMGDVEEGQTSTYYTWRWWPSWYALRTHHVYEIGWLACTIQLFGVTLYGVTAIVILPGILDSLSVWQTNAAYWIPQIVAAACFLIASIMFTLETQEKWWKPEPKVLGWWIGVWSIIGSVGFELSAGFGPTSNFETWAEYEVSLSSMWGSAGYLIGSMLQWYEAVNKRPVSEMFNEPGEMKSYQVHPI